METVVVAFEGEKNGRRLKELLESSGTAACLLCRTADQGKRETDEADSQPEVSEA